MNARTNSLLSPALLASILLASPAPAARLDAHPEGRRMASPDAALTKQQLRQAAVRVIPGLTAPGSVAGVVPILSIPGSAAAAEGPFPMSCTSLDLVLDAFGAVGSSTAGGDALFQANGVRFGTIFEAMAYVPGSGFLEGGSLALPQSAAGARRAGETVVASFVQGPWRYDLQSRLESIDAEDAVLHQEWTITNVGTAARTLAFTSYLDGDLFARGTADDDFGARSGDEILVFDEGVDRDLPTAFLGLHAEAPGALRVHHEVGEFSEQRRRVGRSAFVTDRLVRADGSRADANGDGVTDAGFDVSLAIAADFGPVAPGEQRIVKVRIRWGVGSIDEVAGQPAVVSAGPDRIVECEGAAGTLVRLDASGSPDASRIVSWSWGVDGAVVADAPVADVLLLPGLHHVSIEGVDASGRIATDEAVIEVVDSTPPTVIVAAAVQLWPPDHRMVAVRLPIQATDACSDTVQVVPVAVVSDEAGDARGDGHTESDARLDADGTLWLRAERDGAGDGRVYRVLVEASDAAGNLALAEALVTVPHDARGNAVDSGAASETRF